MRIWSVLKEILCSDSELFIIYSAVHSALGEDVVPDLSSEYGGGNGILCLNYRKKEINESADLTFGKTKRIPP